MRKDARDVAFKMVFEYTFSKEQKEDLINEYEIDMNLNDDDKAYIHEVYLGVVSHYDELKELIAKNSDNFDVERIFKVDFALLLLAIYEIKFMEQIPFKVSVNEAIELAKKYSSEKSVTFVNGVLAKFAR
ncbi:MAG: transcription antitermination factor NusB [Clostridia bacterium]|nr:transcription antitermination factor NusB [Clostridia bacterium]